MVTRMVRICVVVTMVATLAVGAVALAKKPGGGGGSGCPGPPPGWFCPAYYAPVVCGPDDCWYSNDCWAYLSGWQPSECEAVGPGPVPL